MKNSFNHLLEVVTRGSDCAVIFTSPGHRAGTTQIGIRQFDTRTRRYHLLSGTVLPSSDIDGIRFEFQRALDKAQELGYSLITGVS